jgi:hypothetical protein
MKKQYAENYVLNEFGDIDVNYYINKAHQLRSQAIRTEAQKASNAVKQAVTSLTSSLFSPKAA